MKGEERIIELLSEYLRKSDKHEEEMATMQKEFNEVIKRIDTTQKELKAMRLKNDVKHDVLLKEILSLSKRVNALEDLP